MKKETLLFTVNCAKCGKEQPRDEKESNESWNVVNNKPCVYCGGEIGIEVNPEFKN